MSKMLKIPVTLCGDDWLRPSAAGGCFNKLMLCNDFVQQYLGLRGLEDGAKATLFLAKHRFAGSLRVSLLSVDESLFWLDIAGLAKLLWPAMERLLRHTLGVEKCVYVRMIMS